MYPLNRVCNKNIKQFLLILTSIEPIEKMVLYTRKHITLIWLSVLMKK